MHRPTWKSRKFSFQSFQFVILFTTIVTSNGGVLRAKRETNVAAISPFTEHLQIAATTSSTNIGSESNFISMDTAELEEAPNVGDSEIVGEVTETQTLPSFQESETSGRARETTTMPVTLESHKILNANDSTTSTTTIKNADVTPLMTTTSSTSEKLADVTSKPTIITTATSAGITPIVVAMTPKPTTEDPSNLLATTFAAEKLDAVTTAAVIDTTVEPFTSVVDENEAVTVGLNKTEINITTEVSSIDVNTTTTIFEETTLNSVGGETTIRQPSEIIEETTIPANVPETTIREESLDIGTTLTTLINFSLDSTTNPTDTDTTNINEATTELYVTTNKSTKELEDDKSNYDIAINEIKKNVTAQDQKSIDQHPEPSNNNADEGRHLRDQLLPVTSSPTVTTPHISSTSLKVKTTKSHKFIESSDLLRTNDVDSITVANNSFTSTGGAANSMENTLEAGQIDDSILNKVESRENLPSIVDTKQAMIMINSTPTVGDILIPSTPSIEKNRVEDVEDFASNTRQIRIDATQPLTTTERVQNSIPSSIPSSENEENKTTVNAVDTTTRRIERSTLTPTAMSATIRIIENVTTSSNFTPLSAIPIDREFESTTATTGTDYSVAKLDSIIPEQRSIITEKSTTSVSEAEATEPFHTTPIFFPSDSLPTVETSQSNALLTSTTGLDTNRITTIVPRTTPLPIAKQPPTKPRSKPLITKIPPTTAMNTTHIVSTEPTEEYSIQPRSNLTYNPQDITSASPTTTTEYIGSEATEKVTTVEPENGTDYNVIIAISVSVVGIVALILLVGFLYVMRKRQKSVSYGQRCRPVSLDAYSLDNVSIFNSVRRKGASRASKRSYGNAAFDDPSLKHNSMGIHDLAKFVDRKMTIHEEFKDVPQITARPDEVPPGCENKNRYANVIPLPETRVILNRIGDDEKTEYINANYVRGPKDPANYYIACQAPLDNTVSDFWRMIWEQNSRVIIMATDLIENGAEKCAEYIPASMTLDNYVMYGDFQIILKSREVKDKYAVSTLHVKNLNLNRWREITHFWYQWPETGVPLDEASVIAMLLEARSYLKMGTPEQSDEEMEKATLEIKGSTGSLDKTKSLSKTQGPLTVHCSPGTGRTGTIVACDIALRSLEMPKRIIDIPQFVYYVRRGRASAVQTKEQYEFIYKVAHMYATKISGPINDN